MIPTWMLVDIWLVGLVAVAVLVLVPNPARDMVRSTFAIWTRRVRKATTTPIERELALVAGPQQIINDAHQQVLDLQGALQHENNVLLRCQDDLTEAEEAYFRTDEELKELAGGKNGSDKLDDMVAVVAEKEEEVRLQQGVVDGLRGAVSTAVTAVAQAKRELRRLQMTVRSDEAKAKATEALSGAAAVIDAARKLGAATSELAEESTAVADEFNQARARLQELQGSAEEQEFAARKRQEDLSAVRRRLEQKRTTRGAN